MSPAGDPLAEPLRPPFKALGRPLIGMKLPHQVNSTLDQQLSHPDPEAIARVLVGRPADGKKLPFKNPAEANTASVLHVSRQHASAWRGAARYRCAGTSLVIDL